MSIPWLGAARIHRLSECGGLRTLTLWAAWGGRPSPQWRQTSDCSTRRRTAAAPSPRLPRSSRPPASVDELSRSSISPGVSSMPECLVVCAGLQDPPNLHNIIADHVEHQIWEAAHGPDAQLGNTELVGKSQATQVRGLADLAECTFDQVDESQRNLRPGLDEVVIDGPHDVGRSALAKLDGSDDHGDQALDRMRSRNDAKYDASAIGPGLEHAPSSKARRSWWRSLSRRMRSRRYSLVEPYPPSPT